MNNQLYLAKCERLKTGAFTSIFKINKLSQFPQIFPNNFSKLFNPFS